MAEGIEYRCGCRDPETGRKLGPKCPKRTTRGHGKFYPRISVKGADGKRRQPTLGGFPTIGAAKEARNKELTRIRSGGAFNRRQTTGEWLEEWFAGKRNLRSTTRRSYRQHLDDYLLPHLGGRALEGLRASHISAMIDDLLAGTGLDKPLGPATVRRVHATLRSALNAAVKQQRLVSNQALFVELPTAPRPRVSPWSADELGAFLDAAASDRLGTLFEVIALSGLRRGEAIGLRWCDIDVDRGVVTVVQQVVDNGGRIEIGPPKTASGEHRKVHLTPTTTAALLEWRLRQDAERERLGTAYVDSGLVFAREDGRPLRPEYVTRRMQAIAARAGLSRKRLHDLRHGAASLHLAAGVPLPIVSKLLGHSSITITSDTYSHLLEGVGEQAALAAAALVPRAPRPQSVRTECKPSTENDEAHSPDEANALVTDVRRQGLEPRTRGLRDSEEPSDHVRSIPDAS